MCVCMCVQKPAMTKNDQQRLTTDALQVWAVAVAPTHLGLNQIDGQQSTQTTYTIAACRLMFIHCELYWGYMVIAVANAYKHHIYARIVYVYMLYTYIRFFSSLRSVYERK